MKIKNVLIVLSLLVLTLFSACNDVLDNEKPIISSFNIPSKSIIGVIDDNIITLTVENGFDFTTELVPTISVTNGGIVSPASGVAQDFSINPVLYTVYSSNGEQSIYNIVVKEAVIQASAGDVYISEVFIGSKSSASTGVQVDNSYIELYNGSNVDIDLSQFSLKLNDSDSSSTNSLDISVDLTGIISANSTFTIYDKDIDNSLMDSLNLIKDGASAMSDLYLNGITDIDGSDSLELLQSGEVVDCFDSADGKEVSASYLTLKKFIKKGGNKASTEWSDSDWIIYAIAIDTNDDDSVGNHDIEVNTEVNNLTYFAFEEGFTEAVIGIIDDSTKTVTIILPVGTDITNLVPVFGTNGKKVTVSTITQVSAVTSHDFSEDVLYTVWAENGGTRKYTTKILIQTGEVSYTSENYEFNGNIKTVVDAMIASAVGAAQGEEGPISLRTLKDPDYEGLAGTVTGVLTAKGFYGAKTAQDCFFLQDKDAGIYIHTDNGLPSYVELGTKVTISVSEGKSYFGMTQVTDWGSFTYVDLNVPIYYKTGSYDSDDSLGKVFLYEGTIAESMDGYSVGHFIANLYFFGSSDFADSLTAGNTGKFYGPVALAYDKYRMTINSAYQISE